MTIRLKKVNLFIIFLMSFGIVVVMAQSDYYLPGGTKYIDNLKPASRKGRYTPQNWWIIQGKNGVIYVANQGGLAEFDGTAWRWKKIPNQNVLSLAVDKNGTLFIGGNGEIGYLFENGKGTVEYVSLMDKLDKKYRKFSRVWKSYWTKEGVYFQSKKYIFRWDGNKMKVWPAPTRYFFSFLCNGKLYVRQLNAGLMRLEGDRLVLVPGGERFAGQAEGIYMMAGIDDGGVLIGTRLFGLFVLKESGLEPFPSQADGYLKRNFLYHGIRLNSGDFALATLRGGLVLLDSKGRITGIYNRASGLQDDNVKYVYQDSWGDLWLGMEGGVTRIEYSSPFSIYDRKNGLVGAVLSVVHHKKQIFIGTTRGLFILGPDGAMDSVHKVITKCQSLISSGEHLLAATPDGIFHIGNSPELIFDSGAFVLAGSSRNANMVWAAVDSGLVSLQRKSSGIKEKWQVEKVISNLEGDFTSMVEDRDGSLWLGTRTRGAWRVKFSFGKDTDAPVTVNYNTSHGLPGDGENYAARAAGRILIANAKKGIFSYFENENRFIADKVFGERFADGTRGVFRIAEDWRGHIWIHSEFQNFRLTPGKNGSYNLTNGHLPRLKQRNIQVIFRHQGRDTVWLGAVNRLIRYQLEPVERRKYTFPVILRKLTLGAYEFEFGPGGSYAMQDEGRGLPGVLYGEGAVKFTLGAPFYRAEGDIRYRYSLNGSQEQWSEWGEENSRSFSGLNPGVYTFRAQAKNVYGDIGGEALFRFRVIPPWYLRWWAVAGFMLLISTLSYLTYKWRHAIHLEKDKKRLEHIVRKKTRELKIQNRRLELQTKQLKQQSEQLEEMSRIKSRFFANISHEFRTPLTMIMSPLEDMLADRRGTEQEDRLSIMLRNVQQLLVLINQLLELSTLDAGKLELRASRQDIVAFVNGIINAFEGETEKKDIHLKFDSPTAPVYLYFDRDKMEKVIGNLLINAIKYTPGGGEIKVSAGKQIHVTEDGNRKYMELSIRDTGVGIPEDQLPYVFERFHRVERQGCHDSLPGGAGIGLSIVKEFVELHRGGVGVKSNGEKGSEFVVLLPMGDGHLKPEEKSGVPRLRKGLKYTGELTALLKGKESSEVEESAGVEEETVDIETLEGEIILVVEDNPDMKDFICETLRPFYHFFEASGGQEGIDKAIELVPDLIISDVMMPGIQGDELCKRLKSDIRTSHIPIILLTARASEEGIIRGYETGADDYIIKPFNKQILLSRIRNLIDLRYQRHLKFKWQRLKEKEELPLSGLDKDFLARLRQIVAAKMSDMDFTITVLGDDLALTRSTLIRKLRALTGETPHQYIKNRRLEKAVELLKAGVGNVTEVAFEVGFASQSHFTQSFKEKYHRLPSTFLASQPE